MSLDRFDQLVEFKPFYDEDTTKRLLDTYYQVPHTFTDDLKNQLFEHAVHYKLPVEEEQKQTVEDKDFNLMRGIKQMGQGFISGFTTFNVGEPTSNEYERIMRSIGQLGGFLGYIPSAPLKAMKAFQLANMARALKGNSVPLFAARKATEAASKVASKTLDIAKSSRGKVFSETAEFLTKDKVAHVAEGAFNLGVANAVGSWQLGVNEMLSSAAYGATTGGVFRGLANLVNRGGIPKLDQATNKYVYTATQQEDRLIRAAASSLYDGLQSTMRGETTPEQIYSYLLGAYFGANETTAGQDRALKFVNKVEKQAVTNAKELKRLNKDGLPFTNDTLVYDPRLVDGYKDLPKDVQESVMHTIASRHGTLSKQVAMSEAVLKDAVGGDVEGKISRALDLDSAINESQDVIREQRITEEMDEANVKTYETITPKDIEGNKDEVFLVPGESKIVTNRAGESAVAKLNERQGNRVELPIENMTDETLSLNKKVINDALKQVDDISTVSIGNDLLKQLDDQAPETAMHLRQKLVKIQVDRTRAESRLTDRNDIEAQSEEELPKVDFEKAEVIIDRKSKIFVDKFLDDEFKDLATPDKIGGAKKRAKENILGILQKNTTMSEYPKFKERIAKTFTKSFGDKAISSEVEGELRQLFIRQVQQRPIPTLTVNRRYNAGSKVFTNTVKDIGVSGKNAAGNTKVNGDSVKAIEIVGEDLYKKRGITLEERMYKSLDSVVNENNGVWTEIPLKNLSNPRNYGKRKDSDGEFFANKIVGDVLSQVNETGYYYNGGKGDSGKMYFFKYHPDVNDLSATDATKSAYDIVNKFLKHDSNAKDHYNALRKAFGDKYKSTTKVQGFGSKQSAMEYFDKSFLSNMKYDEALYNIKRVNDGDIDYVDWVAENSSIRDSKGFNKRNQIWMTDGFELDANHFKEIYSKSGKTVKIENDQLNYRLFNDPNNKDDNGNDLTSDSAAKHYGEITDGEILVEESVLDAFNTAYGHPESGQNKAFVVDNDPTHGAFLGKMMFHKASPEASRWMRENNLHMLVPESAAKEFGSRKVGDLTVNDNGLVDFDFKGGEDYKMNLSSIKGSLSEKQTQHMLDPQMIPKQMMSNLLPHSFKPIDQKVMDDFYNDIIVDKFTGTEEYNTKLKEALESTEISKETENDILRNMDKVGLADIVDAIKNTEHPEFVGKMYKKILKSNVDNITLDYESGEVTDAEFQENIAEAKTFTSAINRMMEIYPDLAVFLHKDVRNYMQAAMRNFVVNKIVRPKWDYSVSVRMRGYDPWLRIDSKFKDMNMDMTKGRRGITKDRKHLKDTYGVENPDQLFYLDDYYRDVRYDVSDLINYKSRDNKLTLGEIWDKHSSNPKVKEFFKTVSLRVPMDSISGAHELAFAGFTGIKGHGAVFHPRTMRALGGADLDGDKAFVLFGMKKEYRDMYHRNKYEFRDDNGFIKDNKDALIPKVGLDILMPILNDKNNHDQAVAKKIQAGKLTYQDLLTLTNDAPASEKGNPYQSFIGKFTVEGRLDIANKAVAGRDQLGPAVVSKQILNAAYDAIKNNKVKRYIGPKGKILEVEEYDKLSDVKKKKYKEDNREMYVYGKNKQHKAFITPRTDAEELQFARELSRAQIAFGSDPLDELGLSGSKHFYDTLFHSLFKVEYNNSNAADAFTPYYHAKQGTIKIFQDFNRGYFSRNYAKNRRYYSHEIQEFASKIHLLEKDQRGNMLAKMVQELEPLDYSDDIIGRVDKEAMLERYDDYKNLAGELKMLNDSYLADADGNKVDGGLLGRWRFTSISSPVTLKVMDYELYKPAKRREMLEDLALYDDFFNGMSKKSFFNTLTFKAKSSPWDEANIKYFTDKNGVFDQNKYDLAYDNALTFRSEMIDRAYRQGTDFMQNDAMDRASAVQLLYAIRRAREAGVTDEFIRNAADWASHTKKMSRIQRAKDIAVSFDKENAAAEQEGETVIERAKSVDDFKMSKIFKISSKDAPFDMQQKITNRIKSFKLANNFRMGKDKDGNKKTRVLGPQESYLVDTMLMSTFDKAEGLTNYKYYKSLPVEMQSIVDPLIKQVELSGTETLFEKVGLNSEYVSDGAVRDFLKTYSEQFDYKTNVKMEEFDIGKALDADNTTGELTKMAPRDPFEKDSEGIYATRERLARAGKVKLSDFERKMVDELIGHISYYGKSIGNTDKLNQITRSIVRKNFDAMSVEDYRIVNNFFKDMRSGTVFVRDGSLTKDNILKLAERHWMLFPRTVSREMMVKDFEIFTQEGRFQNYKGEWRRGNVGRPTHAIENIQYVLGKAEALAIKMDEDEKAKFETLLRNETGYESLPDGIGQHIAEVVTARRDLESFKQANPQKAKDNSTYWIDLATYENNLKDAEKIANWKKTSKTKFAVQKKGGTYPENGEQIARNIDKVLTKTARKAYKWIAGVNYKYNRRTGKHEPDASIENPMNKYLITKGSGKNKKVEYWFGNTMLPKINAAKFTDDIMKVLKSGKPLDLSIGLDNLRKISRSIQIENILEMRDMTTDIDERKMYTKLANNLSKAKYHRTRQFQSEFYHPHFIQNKVVAKEAIEAAIKKIKDQTGIPDEQREQEIAKLVLRYKSMTGDWIVNDVAEDGLIRGALDEISRKRQGEHFKALEKDPISGNMMSRNIHLPGWNRDLGAWDIYQKNLIDTFYRQIGQIMSKKMLSNFNKEASKNWNNPELAKAWNNYIYDYISRSMGYPSKLPESWLTGPDAKTMKVKGTPYAWFADNTVKNTINRIRRAVGMKDNEMLPENLQGVDEMDIRHWSNLEAKYQMATLLAHPKSATGNIFGGQMHTIQSTGWRNFKNARSVEYWRTNIAGKASEWSTKKDIEEWAISHGVVPNFILYEAGLNPNFKEGKWKRFMVDAKKVLSKDPMVKDETLISLAGKHQITEAMFQKSAWFMRTPERALRRDAFAAHYLQARELYGHSNMDLNDPFLIEMAKKGVQATQFLYSAPYRPAFSATALGKVMTRFQTWAWNSVRFRNDVYRDAKLYGFRRGTPEFERFKRQTSTDMFVLGLANIFAYSLFETAMPQPYSWFQDTADWLFGNEVERDRAFFGVWPTAIAPLQMVTPPGLRLAPALFNSIVTNDTSRLTEYYIWTMFPFGRIARDVTGLMKNPYYTVEKATGIPYIQLAREIKKMDKATNAVKKEDDKDSEELLDTK